MSAYQDITLSPEERAKDLLSQLSLEEKLAQINCYFADKPGSYEKLENIPEGVGHVSTLNFRSVASVKECVEFQRELQDKIMNMSPHHIPAVVHMEGICGAYIQNATSFPIGIGRGASFDVELERKIGEIVGEQERAMGITYTLAPVLDINRDARNGRIGEAYGTDSALASAMGTAFVKGLQENETNGTRTESVAKHFLAYHASESGVNGAGIEMSEKLLREQYAKPFQAAITKGGLLGVMPCYSSINGEPISGSKRYLTDLLRDEMGFQGALLSDYSAISLMYRRYYVAETPGEAGLKALKAGMDAEWANKVSYNEEMLEYFRDGKEEMEILDRAVLNVLEAKFRMGLFEHPYAMDADEIEQMYAKEENEEVSLTSARESLVLLKNNGILPLKKDIKKIAVIGYHASTARIYFSGYTHFSMTEALLADIKTMEGIEDTQTHQKMEMPMIPGTKIEDDIPEFEELMHVQKPKIKSLYEELCDRLPEADIEYSFGYHYAGDDESHFEEALKAAAEADLIILTLGGKNGCGLIASMGENIDSTDINLSAPQEHFMKLAAKLNKPMIGIHFDGRAISSDAADQYLDAIVEAWNPSEMGSQAIVDVLTGEYNPSGKLPIDVPYVGGQIPVYYNHLHGSSSHSLSGMKIHGYINMPHTPRYAFGYGLSYTAFEYSDLTLNKKSLRPDEDLEISLTVTNIGECRGEEIVQLYLSDRYACVTRPVMELYGFQRVTLEPGEKKKVTFRMNMSQTAFLDLDMHWLIEKGDMDVMVGSSSTDIHLKEEFRIVDSAFIEGRDREFYAESDVTRI